MRAISTGCGVLISVEIKNLSAASHVWKECRGALGRVANKAGFTVTRRKVDGVSRYYAKRSKAKE
jgi:hypothetical protein